MDLPVKQPVALGYGAAHAAKAAVVATLPLSRLSASLGAIKNRYRTRRNAMRCEWSRVTRRQIHAQNPVFEGRQT